MNGVSHHRRTSFAVVFAALFVAIAFTAVRADSTIWKSVLGWIAAGTLLLSIAYFINWPGVFGKSEVGSLRWPIVMLMAPMLLFVRIVWQLQNIAIRTPLYNEIVPDLFVGRLCNYESLQKCQQAFALIGNNHHRIYACCANGHGRSVTFMAAWLGYQRKCNSAIEAVRLIQAARPTAAPNSDQMSFLTQVFHTLPQWCRGE